MMHKMRLEDGTELTRQQAFDLGWKWCSFHKKFEPVADFGKSSDRADGLRSCCREATKETRDPDYEKAYREKRKEHYAELNVIWHIENAERRSAYDREKRAARLEYYQEKGRQRQRENPWVYTESVRRRQAAEIQAMPKWADRDAIKTIYRRCAEITKVTGIDHEVDHIVPLRGKNVCGLHIHQNLQILTREENARKSNKLLEAA